MPFGPYKGKPMADVPYKYLLRLWNENCFHSRDEANVKRYIAKNLDAIKHGLKRGDIDPLSFDW